MRLNLILLAPLLALVPVACGSVGDSSSGGNSNGAGGETTGTASTGSGSNSTGNGGASSGSASTGNGSASTGSASTGSASTGSASTGSASTGSASTGSGSASTGSASTGSASTGSGSASTGSASTGSASTGSGSASTGSASSGTASTGSGSGACPGYIDVIAPTGGSQHFATVCEGAWGANETMTALGYQFSGGVPPGFNQLDLLGCASAGATSSGIHFSAANATTTGTFTQGAVSYTDVNGGAWSNTTDPYKVVITKLDAPGGVIEGTFSSMVIGPGDTKLPLSGTFHVCRVSDLNAP